MVSKNQTSYSFEQFNNDITQITEDMQSKNFTETEIRKILRPILKNTKQSKCHLYFYFIATVISLTYFFSYFETISWHLSAIGRIGLIKLLPYWDWTHLKNKQCLIPRWDNKQPTENIFNCNLCENINAIDAYESIDEDILIERYIELDVPLILTRGLENWPKNSSFLKELISVDAFSSSYPCSLSTNTQKDVKMIGLVLRKIKYFSNYFLHFQNCDLEGMKSFRKYTYRPNFLPAIYSPVLYNWLIWNQNYNTTSFKNIELVEKITLIGQIAGNTYLRLMPIRNCKSKCSVLNILLSEGESLIFTNLWNLEYRPFEEGENVAIILETRD